MMINEIFDCLFNNVKYRVNGNFVEVRGGFWGIRWRPAHHIQIPDDQVEHFAEKWAEEEGAEYIGKV